jgi:hypothetical protein
VRIAFAALLLAFAAGPNFAQSAPDVGGADVDRIEIGVSGGWSSIHIALNGRGEGRWRSSEPMPRGRGGRFAVTPRQFALLLERLAPFRQQAVPATAENIREMITRRCQEARVTDGGHFSVRWLGPGTDQYYGVYLGCDPERNAARNAELLAITASLPVPPE